MSAWNILAGDETIQKTVKALGKNGINSMVVNSGKEAYDKVIEMVPKDADVFGMSSVTLETIGVTKDVDESGKYQAVRPKLFALDINTQKLEMKKLSAAPEYAVGSVHAVTVDGHVFVASNSGSQLPAYAYGSVYVIWVVGAQKIVKDFDEALKRIYDYVLPLESEHMRQKYGAPGSNVSKLLIFYKELEPGRITLIFVKEVLGF